MIFKLAWRNIWRNKRRTAITLTSIMMAVFLSNFLISLNDGIFGNMLDNMTRSFLGHVQVHQNGYWDDQTLDNAFEADDALVETMKSADHVVAVTPRIQSFGLASFENQTRASQVVGVDPEKEKQLMDLERHLHEGRSITKDDKGILVGHKLASFLKAEVGDTLVIIGQGYHGISAAGKYEIVGLLKLPSPDLNRNLIVLPLGLAQYLFSAENMLTGYTLVVDDTDRPEKATASIIPKVDTALYEVMIWPELLPEMVQLRTTKVAGSFIYIGILYLIAGFGIFATILMMMAERSYEFGIMLSVGMARGKLIAMMVLETLLITVLGILAGTAVSYPILYYMKVNPVPLTGNAIESYETMGIEPLMMTSTDMSIFIDNGMFLFVISCVIALYPVLKIWKMNPVESMHK
ncbi:MAG: ABC transporter permease [Flavobacteriales bacterium]|nr:ABC transporter permease [Flavobacteriales bacterium]